MILAVSIGDVQAIVDTEGENLTPEHAADYLNRCVDAAMRLFDRLPEDTP